MHACKWSLACMCIPECLFQWPIANSTANCSREYSLSDEAVNNVLFMLFVHKQAVCCGGLSHLLHVFFMFHACACLAIYDSLYIHRL